MFSQLSQLIGRTVSVAATAQRWVAFWGPVTETPVLVTLFVALGSVLTLLLLTGIAAGSLAMLIIALTALYVLLTEVFGISIEIS
ncbi:MAG: hypothetical protein ABSA52_10340 [Candidatus Binatia bacterium]|jgi:hypothetical protein